MRFIDKDRLSKTEMMDLSQQQICSHPILL